MCLLWGRNFGCDSGFCGVDRIYTFRIWFSVLDLGLYLVSGILWMGFAFVVVLCRFVCSALRECF